MLSTVTAIIRSAETAVTPHEDAMSLFQLDVFLQVPELQFLILPKITLVRCSPSNLLILMLSEKSNPMVAVVIMTADRWAVNLRSNDCPRLVLCKFQHQIAMIPETLTFMTVLCLLSGDA